MDGLTALVPASNADLSSCVPPPPLRVSLGLARDEWDGHEPFNEDVHAYTAREDAYEYIDSDEREERRGDRILARRWAAYAYP